MPTPDCTDICEMMIEALGSLGIQVSEDEDHTDMIKELAKCKLVKRLTGKDREWPMWTLGHGDIIDIAKRKELNIAGKDFDEIARLTKKGIESSLEDAWEIAIEEAINCTDPEWKFTIKSLALVESAKARDATGELKSIMENWKGELRCEADGLDLALEFTMVNARGLSSGITAPRLPIFKEKEWEDFCTSAEEFIMKAYSSGDWGER